MLFGNGVAVAGLYIYAVPVKIIDLELYKIYFWMGSNDPTAISNTAADAKAVKVLRNGQFLIIKGEKTYNVMGAIVR